MLAVNGTGCSTLRAVRGALLALDPRVHFPELVLLRLDGGSCPVLEEEVDLTLLPLETNNGLFPLGLVPPRQIFEGGWPSLDPPLAKAEPDTGGGCVNLRVLPGPQPKPRCRSAGPVL